MPPTIRTLLHDAAQAIDSDSARLDAELLLSKATGQARSYFFSWPERTLEETALGHFQSLLQRRVNGEPIAHILEEQAFWSSRFRVTPDTLIPRPDTEVLVEQALAQLPPQQPIRMADLGTGSGCIAISIALERPQWHITAVDKSAAALAVAQSNAHRLKANNVVCLLSSWCDELDDQYYDAIISNPPYIREQDEHLSQGDVRFEPRSALTAGADGLNDIRLISQQALRKLKTGGLLLLEFGYDQAQAVADILDSDGYEHIEQHLDLSGIVRAISVRRP